ITHRSPRKCTDGSNSTYTLICQTRRDGYCVRLRQCCAEEELCLGPHCSSLENCPGSIQTRCMVRMCGEGHTCRRDNECPSPMNCERGRCAMRNNSEIRSENIEQAEITLAKKRFKREKKSLRKHAHKTGYHPASDLQNSSPAKTNQTTEHKSTKSLMKYTATKVESTSTMNPTSPLSETNDTTTEVAPSRKKKSVYKKISHPLVFSSLSTASPRSNESTAEKSAEPSKKSMLTKVISTTTASSEANDKTADFAHRREIKSVHVQQTKNHSGFGSRSIPPSKANESTERKSTEPSEVISMSTW
ncbi:hypothetical protein GCK32_021940, partial [Trichostrongylus colubriformis]